MPKQEQMFEDDKLDPEVAKVADRFIELVKAKKSVKEKFEVQQKNLIGMLNKIGKPRIRHQGCVIEIVHKDESESLKLKEEKKGKRSKQ